MPYMENDDGNSKTMSRRDFLIALGGAAGLAVSGTFLGSLALGKRNSCSSPSDPLRPCLAPGLELRASGDGMEILKPGGAVLCAVNGIGGRILSKMDGSRRTQAIADELAPGLGLDGEGLAAFSDGLSVFALELGRMGLLRDPFYIRVVRNEVRT
jgi:hypothetical protein